MRTTKKQRDKIAETFYVLGGARGTDDLLADLADAIELLEDHLATCNRHDAESACVLCAEIRYFLAEPKENANG